MANPREHSTSNRFGRSSDLLLTDYLPENFSGKRVAGQHTEITATG